MQIQKQDIQYLPLKEIAHLDVVDVEHWCEQHQLHHFAGWMLPQMLAHFGSWTLAHTGGHISILDTLRKNITSDWHRGLWKLTRVKRRYLISKQIAQPEYAAFTPLILAGFKKMQGVAYEQWRGLENLPLVLEPDLYSAVVLDNYDFCSLGSDRLLEIRELGLVTQTGKTMGKLKSPESTWALSGIKDTELGHLPKLTQTMLTQCWLAHPKHRSPYMILDPSNWDNLPPPLISTELFARPETPVVKASKVAQDLPF